VRFLLWTDPSNKKYVVKLLLETGKVDADSKDMDGQTPLWYTAKNGHKAMVKLLLEAGKVDADSKDKDDWTSLWCAAENGPRPWTARMQVLVALCLPSCSCSLIYWCRWGQDT
jgi:ankyrin repeat protein